MRSILICILLVGLSCHAKDTNQPITLRYVKTGQFDNAGFISSGTTFWATNHTTNTLIVGLVGVEARAGTNWIKRPSPPQRLLFQSPGTPYGEPHLPAQTSAYTTLQLPSQPAGTTWRVKVVVQPVLTGFEGTKARLEHYPDMLKRRLRTGDTNMPMNPFDARVTYYGQPTEVVSQEISDE